MPFSVRLLLCSLLVIASITGFLATDLILPAIPRLPELLDGSIAEGQLILAAYVAGNALGLFVFGAISWRFSRQGLMIASMLSFALVSIVCSLMTSIWPLIILRFVQGFFASIPAVIGPGVIRKLFSEAGATKAIGILGSLEALAPAFGPIIGFWLLDLGDWPLSFILLAFVGFALAVGTFALKQWPHREVRKADRGSYLALLKSPVYLRYALSQALVVGGMIAFVMSAPAMIVRGLGGSLNEFIMMQVTGVACFILAANTTSWFVARYGAERVIWGGTLLAALSALVMLGYGLAGGDNPLWIVILFAPFNAGIGFRGPPGFLRAIIAGQGQDDRASSLMVLSVFGVISGGTAILAPFVEDGLIYVAGLVVLFELSAVLLMWRLPALKD